MKPVVFWVVAFKGEADAVIEHYSLVPEKRGRSPFPVWKSKGEEDSSLNHWLVNSGPGKVNAAAAAAWVQQLAHSPQSAVWINFGIAGHLDLEIGSLVRISKVTDSATKRSWYPGALGSQKFAPISRPLITVDEPTSNYPDDGSVVDMECSGFFQTAIRFSSIEFVQAIKVVSDNESRGFNQIDKREVKAYCCVAIVEISKWILSMVKVLETESRRIREPHGFDELVAMHRFSETQQHQLRNLLSRMEALGMCPGMGVLQSARSGREAIAILKSQTITDGEPAP